MPPQGRVGDKAQITACAHGCPACPHPAMGPAIIGSPDVEVNSRPALRVGDHGVHAACCNTNTWSAKAGSPTVFINGLAAHRLGDEATHCGGKGKLVEGSHNVLVDDDSGSTGGNGGSRASSGGAGAGAGGSDSPGLTDSSNADAGSAGASSTASGPDALSDRLDPRWIEVELVDENGAPLAGIRVRVTPSGGDPVEVTTDTSGIARLDGLEPGTCQITLPDHDAAAWRPS